MYRNGGMGPRGPRGHGPGFGPRPGYRPNMGFRPMGMWGHRRPMMGFGGLFILPALMFGGWIVMAVLGSILGLVGAIIGGVFEGLASSTFSVSSVAVGIVIGLVAYYIIRNKKNAREEETGSVDGVKVEQIIEPERNYRETYRA